MSKQIDERVVEMRFDNKDFENNVKTSMQTLENLKAALKFPNVSKDFGAISTSAKNVDLTPIGKSADAIQVKFSALQTVAMTAISNITTSVMGMAKNLATQFTIDPISDGFREYETQINAVQTILANTQSKGSTINDVNRALDELNEYADQTIYNFGEMTQNIGRFTAAGVDLDKSVSAIKGIANLGAMSGSTSAQVSSAMYQLSQALAAGRVSLMDWNSVVNAGMGGEQFQNALKRTAEHFGYDVDAMIEKYGSFRESLTSGGWLTAEVLTETLNQISGAYTEADLIAQGYTEDQAKQITQMANTALDAATKVKSFTQLMSTLSEAAGSGWATSFRTILGDFEEAKEFFTNLSDYLGDMINSQADARNELLSGAFDSNWQKLTDQIAEAGVPLNTFEDKIKEVASEHGIAIDQMVEDYGSFNKVMESGAVSADIVIEAIKRIAGSTDELNGSTEAMTDKLEYFQKVVDEVWYGKWKNAPERFQMLADAGYDYAEVQRLVNLTEDGHRLTLEDLNQEELKAIGYTNEQVEALSELSKQAEQSGTSLNELINSLEKPSGRQLFLDSILNLVKAFFEPLKALRQAFHEVFGISSEDLYNIIDLFHQFTETLVMSEETASDLVSTFKGVFSIFKIFTTIFGGAFGLVFNILLNFLQKFEPSKILEVTGAVGEMVTSFVDFVFSGEAVVGVIDALKVAFESVTKPVADFFAGFSDIQAVKDAGDAIKAFFDPLFSYVEQLQSMDPADAIRKIGEDIKNVFSNLTWEGFLAGVSNISSQIYSAFTKAVEAAKTVGPDIIAGLQNGLKSGAEKVYAIMSEIGQKIIDTIKAVLGIHSPSTEMMYVGENIIQGIIEGIKSLIGSLLETIKGIGDTISSVFGDIDFGQIFVSALAIGGFVGFIKVLGKIADAIGIFAGPMESLGGLLDSGSDLLQSFAKKTNAAVMELRTKSIRNIAISIGILAASLVALTMVDQSKLLGAVVAISVMAGVLTAMTLAITRFAKYEGLLKSGGIASMILALGISLSLMAAALKIVSTIDPNNADKAVDIMQSMGIVVALMIGMVSIAGDKVDKAGKTFTKIGLAFVLLAVAAKIMGGIDAESFSNASNVMGAVMSMIAILLIVTRIAGPASDGAGSAILKISAAMLILAALAHILSGVDQEAFNNGIKAVAKLELLVVGLMAAVRIVGGSKASKIGTSILAVSAAIAILAFVAVQLSDIDPGALNNGLSAIWAFAAIITALMLVARVASGKQSLALGVNLLAISGAIGIMAGIAVLLSYVDPANFWKGYACVAALSALVAGLILVTHYANDIKGTMIAITVAIGILVAGLVILSQVDTAKLIAATAALTVVMGSLAIAINQSKNISKNMGSAIAMAAMLAVLVAGLGILAQFNPENVLASAIGISVVLVTLVGAMNVMDSIGKIAPSAYGAMAALLVAIAALAAIMGVLASMDISISLENALSLSTLLLAMAGVTAILSLIGAGASAALAGAVAMDGVIVVLGALIVGLGYLFQQVQELGPLLDTGIEIMKKIGSGIGEFIGALIGGITSGVMESISGSLPALADGLSDFMNRLAPFISGVQSLSGVDFSGVTNLVAAIVLITGAELLNAITSFIGAGISMEDFVNDLLVFGDGMVKFSDKVKGIDNESVTAAGVAAQGIASLMANLGSEGGILSFFTGDKQSLSDFSEQMVTFGGAIKNFCSSVTGIDTSGVDSAVEAGKKIAELAGSLQSYGGAIGAIFGEKEDLATFSSNITTFGTAITEFCSSVVGIDTSGVDSAVGAGKKIIEMCQSLPQDSGWWGNIFGGNTSLDDFAKQITKFAEAITGYAQKVSGVDFSGIDTSVTNTRKLIDFLKENTEAKGDIQQGANAVSLMSAVGDSIKTFAGKFEGVDLGAVNTAISSVRSLVNLIKSMVGMDTSGIATFQSAIDSLANISITNLVSAFQSMSSQLTSVGLDMMSKIANGILLGSGQVVVAAANVSRQALASVDSYQAIFALTGMQYSLKLGSGISATGFAVSQACTEVMSRCKGIIEGYSGTFYSTGKYLVQGLANGMSENAWIARDAAASVARQAAQAARDELAVQSPSRVAMEIGGFFSKGLGIGIERDSKYVTSASEIAANKAVDGARSIIGQISDIMDADIDYQPTITPVVDLTNVEQGAFAASKMLGGLVSSNTVSSVRVVGGIVDSRFQNGSFTDVVKAVSKLGDKLDGISKPSYSVGSITYDDGSNIATAVGQLVRATRIEGRI